MNILFLILHFYSLTIPSSEGTLSQAAGLNNLQSDPYIVLDRINKVYAEHSYIYHELAYELYADFNSTIPVSIEKGVFIKDGTNQYAQLLPVESLTTADYTIGIDHDEKIIMVSNHVALPANGPIANVITGLTPNADIQIRQVSAAYSDFVIHMEQGEVEEATIRYDNLTFQINKLVLKYRRSIQLSTTEDSPFVQPRLEIDYEKTSFSEEGRAKLNINTYMILYRYNK